MKESVYEKTALLRAQTQYKKEQTEQKIKKRQAEIELKRAEADLRREQLRPVTETVQGVGKGIAQGFHEAHQFLKSRKILQPSYQREIKRELVGEQIYVIGRPSPSLVYVTLEGAFGANRFTYSQAIQVLNQNLNISPSIASLRLRELVVAGNITKPGTISDIFAL